MFVHWSRMSLPVHFICGLFAGLVRVSLRGRAMHAFRLAFLTTVTMCAFAANSLLCRQALAHTAIDAGSFTAFRILAGAVTLYALVWLKENQRAIGGSWRGGLALFVYACAFSFAYISLDAGMGALLLFGAVQITMMIAGLLRGERLSFLQTLGFTAACVGVGLMFAPGLTAPPLGGAVLMVGAGVAWGMYSLLGKQAVRPTFATAGNFIRAIPFAVLVCILSLSSLRLDTAGFVYALVSGALASGLGYALWYAVLPALKTTTAAIVQLTVPILAAVGGIIFLAEPLTWRLVTAGVLSLGGVSLYVLSKTQPTSTES